MRASTSTSLLAILALALVGATLAGIQIPLISDYRGSFIALAVIGFLACAHSPMTRFFKARDWLSWNAILGVVLGVLGLTLVVSVVAGIELPMVLDDRQAFISLAFIMFAKLGIGAVHRVGTVLENA